MIGNKLFFPKTAEQFRRDFRITRITLQPGGCAAGFHRKMKKILPLLTACIFGFTATIGLLFFVFSGEKPSNAQSLPFMPRQREQTVPPVQTPPALPIPETPSTLPRPNESPLYIERYAELLPEERNSIQVYERCNKSVVNIDTQTTISVFLIGEFDEPGAGSGIVLDKAGHILTNSHVISKANSVSVTLFNGDVYPATVVGEDPITDLAVVKIKAPEKDLFPAVTADSSRLLIGQKVYAIGNPFGLERTFTGGLISSLNRSIPGRFEARSIKGVIQIDAAINPGNSGGVLLDSQGRMIGINTAIASQSGGSNGIGFAIPANTIARIAPQLIRNGKVVRGDVGIMKVREVERDGKRGLMVISLVPKGAAEKAGLRCPKVTKERQILRGAFVIETPKIDMSAADMIVAVNGSTTKKADDFTAVIDEHKPGDKLMLDVLRNGNMVQIAVVLE